MRRLVPSARRVPILMYHGVADDRKETSHPYFRTVTTVDVFRKQVRYLHENGYSSVKASEVPEILNGFRDVRKPVAITFDDGLRDFYSNAFPILAEYGFTATMYLPTGHIGDTAREFKGAPCMTWSEICELHRAGIEFGSHTVSHPQLADLTPERVRGEVVASRSTIEDKLGTSVESFSYPFAFPETNRAFTRELQGMLQEAGYQNGVSTMIGTAEPGGERFFMKRLPVNSCDDTRLFEAKLAGAYDWLHAFQYASKLVAHIASR
jgi:peptidoglycan/xylan/chitin deacetylase (PgdA/CDA1 family)